MAKKRGVKRVTPVMDGVVENATSIEVSADNAVEITPTVDEGVDEPPVEKTTGDGDNVEAVESVDAVDNTTANVEEHIKPDPVKPVVNTTKTPEKIDDRPISDAKSNDDDLRTGWGVVLIKGTQKINKDMIDHRHIDRVRKDNSEYRFNDEHNMCFVGLYPSEREAIIKRKRLLSYGVVGNVEFIALDDHHTK